MNRMRELMLNDRWKQRNDERVDRIHFRTYMKHQNRNWVELGNVSTSGFMMDGVISETTECLDGITTLLVDDGDHSLWFDSSDQRFHYGTYHHAEPKYFNELEDFLLS